MPQKPRSKPKTASKGGYPVNRKRRAYLSRKVTEIDHKNLPLLRRYITEFGQIEPRKRSGNAPATQRMVTLAIKRARHLALLPFVKN